MPGMFPALPNQMIFNEYQLNIGPTNVDAAVIIEGELPNIEISGITVNDRLSLFYYIKSILFPRGFGEDTDLLHYGNGNLLSHMKIKDINPYNTNPLYSSNPYKSLPDGFLLYRSCYPIKAIKNTVLVECSRNSLNVNMRIYELINSVFMALKSSPHVNYNQFDQLREISYYEFIRESILKLHKSPNFILLYGYYITIDTIIEFDKIRVIKYGAPHLVPPLVPPIIAPIPMLNPQAYSGKNIVMLTEAPTYNIINWASIIYEVYGTIKHTVNTGYHEANVWFSILFQLMAGLYTLQKSQICLNDMTLERNIFIKDLALHNNVIGFWKYIIDGIEYYVPNYGYLLLIDSHFKNIDSSVPPLYHHTIQSSPLFRDTVSTHAIMYNEFKKLINMNNFSGVFISNGGCTLPGPVSNLIDAIHNSHITSTYIDDYISKYMTMFLHNRIGTYLKEYEINNIRRLEMKEFKRGEIVVYMENIDAYKFALFLQNINGLCYILCSHPFTSDIIQINGIHVELLSKYASNISIEQDYKSNLINYSEIHATYKV